MSGLWCVICVQPAQLGRHSNTTNCSCSFFPSRLRNCHAPALMRQQVHATCEHAKPLMNNLQVLAATVSTAPQAIQNTPRHAFARGTCICTWDVAPSHISTRDVGTCRTVTGACMQSLAATNPFPAKTQQLTVEVTHIAKNFQQRANNQSAPAQQTQQTSCSAPAQDLTDGSGELVFWCVSSAPLSGWQQHTKTTAQAHAAAQQ